MSSERQYPTVRDGTNLQVPMERVSTLVERDRQVELARKYGTSGQLEAERLRVREREKHVPYHLPPEPTGFVRNVAELTGAGVLYCCAGIIGWGITGTLWGALAGVFAFSLYVAVVNPI